LGKQSPLPACRAEPAICANHQHFSEENTKTILRHISVKNKKVARVRFALSFAIKQLARQPRRAPTQHRNKFLVKKTRMV
jgi:hypothetical protein